MLHTHPHPYSQMYNSRLVNKNYHWIQNLIVIHPKSNDNFHGHVKKCGNESMSSISHQVIYWFPTEWDRALYVILKSFNYNLTNLFRVTTVQMWLTLFLDITTKYISNIQMQTLISTLNCDSEFKNNINNNWKLIFFSSSFSKQ